MRAHTYGEGLGPEQVAYLDYVNDANDFHPVWNQERISAVAVLNDFLEYHDGIRVGNAVIGPDVRMEAFAILQKMNEAGRLGAAIIAGDWTKIDTGNETVIGDRAVVVDCEMSRTKITNSDVRDAILTDTSVARSRVNASGAKSNPRRSNLSRLENVTVVDSDIIHSSFKNGTIDNVNGSTDGQVYPGSLRNTFVGVDPSTGNLKFS